MNKKFLILVSLLLVTVMVFTACSKSADTPKDTGNKPTKKILRTNNSSEPGTLDPALAQGTHESWVLDHIFEGLFKHSPDGTMVPGMAKEYTLADDEVTYTFTLRDGIKWSNGDPVTAHDFEYSWKRALDPNLAAEYAYQFYYLKGGEAYNTGAGSVDEVGVKALDDKTLEVTLEAPTAYFLELTSFYTYFPVNQKVAEANPNWAKSPSTYVSNGPFKLTEWVHNAKIVIMKNENYYDAANVKLDGIDFAILDDENTAWQKYEGGEFDFLTPLPQAVVAQMKAQNNPELVIGGDVATYYYNFNTKIKPFDNVKIRKALAMAIDRQTIVDKIAQGGQVPAEGVVPFGMLDENNKEYRDAAGKLVEFNLTEAKKLFQEGLTESGYKAEDFSQFAILYNTSEGHKKIAQAIQEMWRANLGIEVQLENVDFQVKLDREKAGDFQISRAGWTGDYVDPMTFVDLWVSSSSFNDAKFNNAEYDALVAKAKSTTDQEVRMEAMRQAEKILMDNMPVLPIYHYTQPYAQKSYVTDVFKPLNRYPYFIYADMNK
ncbi:peptide ABC transporter substrate-binding protein [Tissierella carlieri]|uniref:peptide ABC transporter substrate-binding protein n=1 Tax=Tissierella carlieri TaxID=689904 RepID=UPI003863835E